ncbi:unnamed protein product [Prorocentrum cordatum]|uniref:Expansin-like EG45 domain-containing protein n=1 Tax=Prorocentrum cordatum TaxID=2364126 RepID=A0ABN9XFF9_9DINO|nr:unnamed protein product [Polarella glacialis]
MKDPISSTTGTVLSPYLMQGLHCSIGTESPAYGNGERCGACYRVRSTSNDGWTGDSVVPGTMSEAVVTVSTSGITGAGRFDCFPEAFEAITGAATGEFAIEFEEVECEAIQSPPSVTSLEEENAHFCKLVFNNIGGWGTLLSVKGCLGEGTSNCREMQRLSGQAWQGCPTGAGEAMTFFLTQQDPSGQGTETVECACPGGWPWERGRSCTCGGANFRGATTTETTTAPPPPPTPCWRLAGSRPRGAGARAPPSSAARAATRPRRRPRRAPPPTPPGPSSRGPRGGARRWRPPPPRRSPPCEPLRSPLAVTGRRPGGCSGVRVCEPRRGDGDRPNDARSGCRCLGAFFGVGPGGSRPHGPILGPQTADKLGRLRLGRARAARRRRWRSRRGPPRGGGTQGAPTYPPRGGGRASSGAHRSSTASARRARGPQRSARLQRL